MAENEEPKLNLGGEKPKVEKKLGYVKQTTSREFKKSHGDFEAMQKSKKESIAKVFGEIERLLKDYDGGGVAIVVNRYDENGDVTGNEVAIMGVDKTMGLLKLSQGLSIASEDIVETIMERGGTDLKFELLRDLLKGMKGN